MTDVKKLVERGTKLFTKRSSIMSLWQDIADNFYPERAQFTYSRDIGDEFASHLNSSYPIMVRRELGNAFSAMLRPRSEEWFSISVDNDDELDTAGKEWLEWASGVQRRAMYDRLSGFVRATKEGDNDFAAFGQCVLSREIDWKEQVLLYRCWHLKDVAWTEKYNGQLGEVHRKWKPEIGYLKKRFKSLHRSIASCKDDFKEIECRHVVMPTEDYDGKQFRTPYVSLYVDAENDHILEETGSWSKVYTIPRWQTVSGSQYAYSPATVAGLPDARLIQAMTLTLLEAGEMAVRPPLVGVKEAIRSDVQVFAGGITWADAEYDERMGEVLRPLAQDKSALPFGIEMNQDTRQMLASCFYLNKLTLPPADREMTAYETGQRIQEYIRSALPLFEPMEVEYNGDLCEGTFDDLMRVGAFSNREMPRSLSGQEVRFKFTSPLHDAIERKKGTKFLEAKQLIREAVELDPSTIAALDARKSLRDALFGIGTPAAWVRDEEVVEQMAEQQQAQQEAEGMAQQIGGAAQVAEQIGKADQALNAAA